MSSRRRFLSGTERLRSALAIPHVANDGIGNTEHNAVANILRKGLGILAFTVLEDFVRDRSGEALRSISSSLIEFSNLPDKLQSAATEGATRAVLFQSRLLKKSSGDWMGLIQDECEKINSTSTPEYEISALSFFSSSSNVGPDDISQLFGAICIKSAWRKMTIVSNAIGGGIPDLEQAYFNAMMNRHKAAHTAEFQYGLQTLSSLINEITAIAASIDILISARCRQIAESPQKKLEEHSIDRELSFRFLEKKEGRHRETRDIGGRARKIWDCFDEAIAAHQPKLVGRREFLVRLDEKRRIAAWYT